MLGRTLFLPRKRIYDFASSQKKNSPKSLYLLSIKICDHLNNNNLIQATPYEPMLLW